MKPALGPPLPDQGIVACRDTMFDSTNPADVVEAVLTFLDRNRAIVPTGGGMAIPGRARPYAEAVVAMLTERGMLANPTLF